MNGASIDGRPTVLAVDDTPDNLAMIASILKDSYRVKIANGGERALAIASADPKPDLILLDIVMPGIDGYRVCETLKSDARTREIPVIFLTSLSDPEDERRGLVLGAVDYIGKPISPAILRARVRNHLDLKALADFLRDKNEFLEAEVKRRTSEVRAVQEVTILSLASLAETRDNDTGNHLRRTQRYVRALAIEAGKNPEFSGRVDSAFVELAFKSAPLHDIGKVGIPDSILLKPGKLEPAEFEVMKRHAELGYMAIEHAERSLGAKVGFLSMAKEIARSHHERWDGSGYPDGLLGEAIPLSARIMALADVYDALISKRVYKGRVGHDEAARILEAGAGSHFDPRIFKAFETMEGEFVSIASEFADDA